MKQIALFPGSYNPVHIGHLALANWICEYTSVDELWFLVSPHNPLKKIESLLPDEYRLELLTLAIGDYPKFKVCDIEFTLPRPSYTIHTLEALTERHPDCQFTIIIGADSWNDIQNWKDYQSIIERFRIMVYPRSGYKLDLQNKPQGVSFVDAPLISVSSTFIREALIEGKDLRFFLPESIQAETPKIKELVRKLD